MPSDPRFSSLLRLMPDEIRSYLTGLTGVVAYPSSRPDPVFRLIGEWEEDLYLKMLGLDGDEVSSLRDEAMRLEWLNGRLPVPGVLARGSGGGYEFLLTKAVPGIPANDRSSGRDRQEVASLIGRALKQFHSVPIADCPFRHPAVGPTGKEDEVLVHGDYCLTNVLFDADGFDYYLDVGEAEVGDHYIDIVAGIWSLRHNYGRGSVANLLSEYGMRMPDRKKLAAYWRWWNSP
jgi:aminoglycoside phosphotransferase